MNAEAQKKREELEPVTIKVKPELLEAIDSGEKVHGEGRGQFIRNAIADRLLKLGYKLGPEAHLATSRKGVGGQPTHKKPIQSVSLDSRSPEKTAVPQVAGQATSPAPRRLTPRAKPHSAQSDPSRDPTLQTFVGAIAVDGGKKALRSLGLPEKAASTSGNIVSPKRAARTKSNAQLSPANLVPK